MSDDKAPSTAQPPPGGQSPEDSHALEGEPGIPSVSQRPKVSVSRKGVVALVTAIVSLGVVSGDTIEQV